MEFGGRLGLGLWERNARGQRAGMLPGFRLGSWMSGVHPMSLPPLAAELTDAKSHSLSGSWASLFRKTVLFLLMIMIEDFQPIGMLESS